MFEGEFDFPVSFSYAGKDDVFWSETMLQGHLDLTTANAVGSEASSRNRTQYFGGCASLYGIVNVEIRSINRGGVNSLKRAAQQTKVIPVDGGV